MSGDFSYLNNYAMPLIQGLSQLIQAPHGEKRTAFLNGLMGISPQQVQEQKLKMQMQQQQLNEMQVAGQQRQAASQAWNAPSQWSPTAKIPITPQVGSPGYANAAQDFNATPTQGSGAPSLMESVPQNQRAIWQGLSQTDPVKALGLLGESAVKSDERILPEAAVQQQIRIRGANAPSGITTKQVEVGGEVKQGKFDKNGNLLGYVKGPDGNDIVAPRSVAQPSVENAILGPILQKQLAGKPLTEGEKNVLGTLKPNAQSSQEVNQADTAVDPESESILKQTGLSFPAYLVLTGKSSQLPRDAATRTRAFSEATKFANDKGVDVSTLSSQFGALNETLGSNIKRVNQTKIMEGELQGTLDNLKPVADAAGLGRLRVANVGLLFAGKEFNDPVVAQYAFQLNQLRSELAGYNGAVQGRSGNNITEQDYREAERVIKNGLSSGGATGLQTAVKSATEKMTGVLNQSVDRARQGVWDVFGVGKNYKPKYGAAPATAPAASSANGFKYLGKEP